MAEKSLEIDNTLVKYNNPFLVIKHLDKGGASIKVNALNGKIQIKIFI